MYPAGEIKGSEHLTFKWREAFQCFSVLFWQAQGAGEREGRRPVKVALSYDRGEQVLKVTCADGEWYHVSLEGDWY